MTAKSHRLRQARLDAGFATAREGAARVGVKYSTYAGHENGSRDFDNKHAIRYARAFRVAPEWLLLGREPKAPATDHSEHSRKGFDEPGLAPWTPKDPKAAEAIVSLLAPTAQHPAAYKIGKAIAQLFFRAGDILIVDLNAPAVIGDTAIAQKVDEDTGTAETLIGRFLPPYIVPADPTESETRIDGTVSIVGPVVSSFREPLG